MTVVSRALYHYCCEHSAEKIGTSSGLLVVVPLRMLLRDSETRTELLPGVGRYVWFTDLAKPVRSALGLTSTLLDCDRTQHRYRVVDSSSIRPWVTVRRDEAKELRALLEGAPGVRPRHWFVSSAPVAVKYDPIRESA